MTIAELRGKLSSEVTRHEDLLTSDVFGTLKNIDRQTGLGGFLKLVEIELAPDELEYAEFRFWEKMSDRTEPDVSIRTASTLIFIEAKYLTALGTDPTQLQREFENGAELGILCAVKMDRTQPDSLYRIKEGDAAYWCAAFEEERFKALPFKEGAPVEEGDTLVEWRTTGWLAACHKYPLSSFQDRASAGAIAENIVRFRDMAPRLVEWIKANQDKLLETNKS